MWRRAAVAVACMGVVLAAPCGAAALSTHSATAKGSFYVLEATAKCGANEHVVSGGFSSSIPAHAAGEVVSRAVDHHSGWTVDLFASYKDTLTTYAYCARNGKLALSTHEHRVPAASLGPSDIPDTNTVGRADCAPGETLVSGGFALLDTGQNSLTYRDYAASASRWTVT